MHLKNGAEDTGVTGVTLLIFKSKVRESCDLSLEWSLQTKNVEKNVILLCFFRKIYEALLILGLSSTNTRFKKQQFKEYIYNYSQFDFILSLSVCTVKQRFATWGT